MVCAKDGVNPANLVPNSLHEVRRREMVRVPLRVERRPKFDVCLRVHALKGIAACARTSNRGEYLEPIPKVAQARDKQALRVCTALLDEKEKLEEFACQGREENL